MVKANYPYLVTLYTLFPMVKAWVTDNRILEEYSVLTVTIPIPTLLKILWLWLKITSTAIKLQQVNT